MEDRNFMKFESQTSNRVVDYQKIFGEDLSAFARARSKNVHTAAVVRAWPKLITEGKLHL